LAFAAEEAKSLAEFADYFERMGWVRVAAGNQTFPACPV